MSVPRRPRVWPRWARLATRIGFATALLAVVLSGVAYLLLPAGLSRVLGVRPGEFAVDIERGHVVTASDGTRLVADVYRPRGAGPKTPTILVRIPYSKTVVTRLFGNVLGRFWAEHGYTAVIQGTRGRYESGGTYYPLRGERQDGLDTLAWLKSQPWFDGRLGMWGGSYFGYTQWVLADQTNPGPTALLAQLCSTDLYRMF
jgi:predicted acyl esterase